MKKKCAVPVIYNLFPRHFKSIHDWKTILPHVTKMGFTDIFVNPFHETGFSGSLYSVKNYYRLNPLFLDKGDDPSDAAPLAEFIESCNDEELGVIMDLVVNHTAIDADLIKEHPQWYKYDKSGKIMNPFAIDPANPSNVTVWGDLAIIDNEASTQKESLWKYWDEMIAYYQKMGIYGFRCDAAYQVPAPLWKYLISAAKKRNRATIFYAETLGCTLEQIKALADVGFDYLFNSSKWWNFDQPWALEQHEQNKAIAPSISFPESHDTQRLASEMPGSIDVQKCRYAFASLFSQGIMMTMGYEHGVTVPMNVVNGKPDDVKGGKWDISEWVAQINKLKCNIPVLCEEGTWQPLCDYKLPYLFLKKSSTKGNPPVFVCVNKRLDAGTMVDEWMIPPEVKTAKEVYSLLADTIESMELPHAFELDPADVVLFVR
ncbi:MAG TPA: alpha-amylase family glycosyl hydrolase [Chitinispirillaceae bacterium]|nr:alpha-amylase family glycosyl hydrolase [Chitinispirillaceae bacterium]